MTPESASLGLAVVFVVTWIAAARWAGPTVGGLPKRVQKPLYVGALVAGLLLTIAILRWPALRARLWKENLPFDWAMVGLCAIGFGWCWWARLHLGNLWSAGVTLREGHRVIDTGPYGIVRHPIYTGGMLAAFAFAAARGRPFDLLIALLVAVFFTCKAWLEERLLQEEFGTRYDAYRRRVPMLVPFLRLRGSR